MRRPGYLSAIPVKRHLSPKISAKIRILNVIDVISHIQHQLIGDKTPGEQLERQLLRHLPDDDPAMLKIVRLQQNLSG